MAPSRFRPERVFEHPPRCRPMPPSITEWAQALLSHTNALVDVYAAALSNASTKHGNQVKPEDVRSLLVTVFIQRSRSGPYAG